MLIANQEGYYVVDAVNWMGEYHRQLGLSGSEWLSHHHQWILRDVIVAETEFGHLPPFWNPYNSSSGASGETSAQKSVLAVTMPEWQSYWLVLVMRWSIQLISN